MSKKGKQLITHNRTLDQFVFKIDSNHTVKQEKKKLSIKVPPSSGLPASTVPNSPVMLYPLNPQFRQYQHQIVASCVCRNTLVCLPTGLGKTHIAAILIANFCRWFPDHKIVFLAPTRPLVRQQMSALFHLQDQVPRQFVFEANGQIPPHKRQDLYSRHRVIFATPQTVQNDLKMGRMDGTKIILMIFDECHRSVGNSSYAQIIRFMNGLQFGFRVIGLSATPGSENQKIQQVIFNLNIARMIYKDEHDLDVKKYLHERIVKEIQISQTDIIKQSLQILEFFAKPSFGCLIISNLIKPWLARRGLAGTSFFLIRGQCNLKINELMPSQKQIAYSALKILGFLFRCRKALKDQGYQTFKRQFFAQFQKPNFQCQNTSMNSQLTDKEMLKLEKYLSEIESALDDSNDLNSNNDVDSYSNENSLTKDSRSNSKNVSALPPSFRQKVESTAKFQRLYELFHQGNNKSRPHPKLQRLAQILSNFFKQQQGKAIVFTNYKVTSKQIKEYLSGIQEIKGELFFGQSKTVIREEEEYGESFVLQLKQKQQLQVIQKYKRGQINTLISTSIGEEGLDIGEVDCIIFYDGGHSPIRSIQRRGRTGRKRTGYVYILMMEGKESCEYKKGKHKQTQMKNILKKSSNKFQYYSFNSSLFQQNTEIPIQLYQNVISTNQSGKKTKVIISPHIPKDIDKKKTKKHRKDLNQQQQVEQNQNSSELLQVSYQENANQAQSNYYNFQYSNLNTILQKYKDQKEQVEQNIDLQANFCLKIQPISINDDIRYKCKCKQDDDDPIVDANLADKAAQSLEIFNAKITEQQSIGQNQSEGDELFQQFEKYRLRKQQLNKEIVQDTMSVEANNSENSSMSSQQMLQILQKLGNKPKPYYNLQDFEDS